MDSGEEHAVLLNVPLSKRGFGGRFEFWRLQRMQRRMARAIARGGVGELDGDLIGQDWCVVYMYGPDADALWKSIESVVRKHRLTVGAYAIKRYGSASDAREVRIEI